MCQMLGSQLVVPLPKVEACLRKQVRHCATYSRPHAVLVPPFLVIIKSEAFIIHPGCRVLSHPRPRISSTKN